MYKTDPVLFEKFKSRLQTKSNNNDPSPLAYITRNRTPITTQRFWEKLKVTSTVGTRSSIAVRRSEGNLTGDVIFVAQVEDGNAVIRKSDAMLSLTDMTFVHTTTISNVSELSIMFDGYMKMVEGKVESYTTGDLPIVFYVDSSNSLKGWNMNTDVTFTISDTAYNVASVRGLYSEAADLNDGIFVFYTNASGELWEARVLNDEVTELTQITLLPTGVTGWVDVWASLTFDYRVVLQLKGNDGNVYTLLAASRPSGFSLIDYLEFKISTIQPFSGGISGIAPHITRIYNSILAPNEILLDFDSDVFIHNNPSFIWIENDKGDRRYPSYVNKENSMRIRMTFQNLIGLEAPFILNGDLKNFVLGGPTDGWVDLGQTATLYGVDLRHMGVEIFDFLLSSVDLFNGQIRGIEELKLYSPNEILPFVLSVDTPLMGDNLFVNFLSGASPSETLTFDLTNQQSFTGVVVDINGVPI